MLKPNGMSKIPGKPLSWWISTPLYATRKARHALRVRREFLRGAAKAIQTKFWRDRHLISDVWIDVGAHKGEYTYIEARSNPMLRVYAFEANLDLASKLMGRLPNYIILPMAVGETDGALPFNINKHDGLSSALTFDPETLEKVHAKLENVFDASQNEVLRTETVPCVRLDTFMNGANIHFVDFLKIDTQGFDFAVVRSLGDRLRDVGKIQLECSTDQELTHPQGTYKGDIVAYLLQRNWRLVKTEVQSNGLEENLTFENKDEQWTYQRR